MGLPTTAQPAIRLGTGIPSHSLGVASWSCGAGIFPPSADGARGRPLHGVSRPLHGVKCARAHFGLFWGRSAQCRPMRRRRSAVPHTSRGPAMAHQGEITRILAEQGKIGREALDQLLPLVYQELRRVAHRRLRQERGDHTLATTDLVHEAYLKLVGLERIKWENRAQFFALSARAMRRILVDYAVRRKAQKRGGGGPKLALSEVSLPVEQSADQLLALDAALERLAARNQRHCRIVECRYFAGMNIEETAEALGVS
ncbi:MAG: sigma-70 family RNA polymerase sigma factor, partial [Gemmatimonas sp.]|nr:sigma-70 family RNA polymerase sigma factor [Gemmatimonas sp.]